MDPEVQLLGNASEGPKPASVEKAPDRDLHKDSAGVSLPQSPATGLQPSSASDDDVLKLPNAPGYEDTSEPSAPSGYFDPPPALPSPISPPVHNPLNYTPSTGQEWAPTPPPGTTSFGQPLFDATAPATSPPTFAPSQPPTAAVAPPPVSSPTHSLNTAVPPPANVSRPVVPPASSSRVVPVAPAAPGGFSQVHQQVTGNFITDDMAMSQAQKHAKWAISALNFEDVPTAVRELRRALEALGAT